MRALATALFVVLVAAVSPAADGHDIYVRRLSVSPKGTVRLRAQFDPQIASPGVDPWLDGFTVTLNGLPVATASMERGLLRAGSGLRFTYREKGLAPCRVRMDLGAGTLTVKARDPALTELLSKEQVTVSLRIGEEDATSTVRPSLRNGKLVFRQGGVTPPGPRVAFRTLASDDMGPSDGCGVRVARTAEEYDALWREVTESGDGTPPPAPEVDFGTEMVVGVLLGFRPSSGYSVKVLSARERGDGGFLQYLEVRPTPKSIVLTVVTGPWTLVAMPRRYASVGARAHVRLVGPR